MSKLTMLDEAVAKAVEKYTMNIAWTAAAMMHDRLKNPHITVIEGDGLFDATPQAVGRFVTGYAMEEDASLADELVASLVALAKAEEAA